MSEQKAYILGALRSPVGKYRGVFKHYRPDDLLAEVIAGLMRRHPAIKPEMVEDVIIGCAMPEAEQGMNVARNSALLAGLPDTVPGMTINRFCSSGVQTIATACDLITTGNADVIIAGGTESMSMVPLGGHTLAPSPAIFSNNNEHVAMAYGMGLTAEIVAKRWDISRAQQEAFALESHRRALEAIAHNEFVDEILPIEVTWDMPNTKTGVIESKTFIVKQDEGPRAGSTLELLAKLPTVFKARGTVTAATSSQMSDGAGAVLVVSEKIVNKLGLKPMARMLSFSVAGVPPDVMGIGPIKAIPKALDRAGIKLSDVDWIELNEAFAAQSLAVMKDLSLDPAKVNPLGGAIALGHPLGATGAIRAATLLHGMKRRQLRYGMVTMCIGTGMGAAGIFENLQ